MPNVSWSPGLAVDSCSWQARTTACKHGALSLRRTAFEPWDWHGIETGLAKVLDHGRALSHWVWRGSLQLLLPSYRTGEVGIGARIFNIGVGVLIAAGFWNVVIEISLILLKFVSKPFVTMRRLGKMLHQSSPHRRSRLGQPRHLRLRSVQTHHLPHPAHHRPNPAPHLPVP